MCDILNKENVMQLADNISKYPNKWMQLLFSRCTTSTKQLTLRDLVILGSHDSATGYINNVHWSIGQNKIVDIIARPVIQNMAQTQYYGFYEQLNAGVRYFDCRPFIIDKNYVYHHGMVTINYSFEQSMLDIKMFLQENPKEYVILYISHIDSDVPLTVMNHQHISEILQSTIGNYVIPTVKNPLFETIDGLNASGKNILIIYDNEFRSEIEWLTNNTLSSNNLQSYWMAKKPDENKNICKVDYLAQSWSDIKKYYIECFGKIRNGDFLKVMQLHLQPDDAFLINGLILPYTEDLETGANSLNQNICEYLTDKHLMADNYINIVEIDFHDQSTNLLKCFILANLLKINNNVVIDEKIIINNKKTFKLTSISYVIFFALVIAFVIFKFFYKKK